MFTQIYIDHWKKKYGIKHHLDKFLFFRCILASDCNRETVASCKGPATEERGSGGSVDLRFDENYVCCSSKDIISTDPIECFDIPNHE